MVVSDSLHLRLADDQVMSWLVWGLGTAPVALALVDSTGVLVGVNEALLRYTGYDGIEIPLAQQLGAKLMRVDVPLLAVNNWIGVAPTTSTSYNAAAPPLINSLKAQCTAACK